MSDAAERLADVFAALPGAFAARVRILERRALRGDARALQAYRSIAERLLRRHPGRPRVFVIPAGVERVAVVAFAGGVALVAFHGASPDAALQRCGELAQSLVEFATREWSLTRRCQALLELADAQAASRDVKALCTSLAQAVQRWLGAAGVGVLLSEEAGLETAGSSGLALSTAATSLVGAAVESGFAESGLHVAMLLRDRVPLGAVCVSFAEPTSRRRADLALIEELAPRMAGSISAARLAAQKDEFLNHAAHELRTPLTSIKGFSFALARHVKDGVPADGKAVGAIERQADRLNRLIHTLLEVARLDAGRLVVSRERFDLSAVAMKAVREVQSMRRTSPIEVVAEREAWVYADEARVEHVLVALLSNALEASPPNCAVRLEIVQRDGRVETRVTDSGAGISAHHLRRLFDRAPIRRRSGLGVSLWLARELASRMGGALSVESVPGTGSCFALELPGAFAEVTRPVAPGRRVLVVDDDGVLASMLADVLTEHGFEARFATGGQEALDAVEAGFEPDTLLLDLKMPGIDGPLLAKRLRQRNPARAPRIIVLSGDGEAREKACRLMAHALVQKPFDLDDLLATMSGDAATSLQ